MLTEALEAACLRQLRAAYAELNSSRFAGALKPASLVFSDGLSRLGRWDSATRTIELARALLVEHGWARLIEVLKHEMVHQYVWEVARERDQTAHGPLFQTLCDKLGVDGAATGLPDAQGASPDRIVERVTKLLALAGSPNENEARLAMAAAQRLMLRYNLELAAHAGKQRYGSRHLGQPTGRIPEAERILAGLLGSHFFVECIWIPVWRPLEGKRGLILEICGRSENLELAAHVHAFLLGTAERLWKEWRRASRAPERERRTYQAGVMAGFRETLEKQAAQHQAQALVWAGDAALRGFLKRRYPYTRSSSYTVSPASEAKEAGRAAGRSIVLHKPVQSRAERSGRLLS